MLPLESERSAKNCGFLVAALHCPLTGLPQSVLAACWRGTSCTRRLWGFTLSASLTLVLITRRGFKGLHVDVRRLCHESGASLHRGRPTPLAKCLRGEVCTAVLNTSYLNIDGAVHDNKQKSVGTTISRKFGTKWKPVCAWKSLDVDFSFFFLWVFGVFGCCLTHVLGTCYSVMRLVGYFVV